MNEDDIYRTSTQYRLWSFTPDSLASLRSTTNSLAADRVRAAIKRLRQSQASGSDAPAAHENGGQSGTVKRLQEQNVIDCLSVEEEKMLVGYYCSKAMELADFCDFPTNVKVGRRPGWQMRSLQHAHDGVQGTAVQYLKRFYLSNSPMTYHPKEMMPSAIFLSTKTENHYTSLKAFVSKLPKTTAEDVVAPEFLLTQGLRFTFDVRHPQRGLEGGLLELLALATGKGQPAASLEKTPIQLQGDMMKVEPTRGAKTVARSPGDLKARIQNAHGKAKDILKTSALLTDAYFLYTPAQIWLATLLLVDEPLALFYLDVKLPPQSGVKLKLVSTLRTCAETLQSSASMSPSGEELKELTRIDKKLYKCRNPEKMDLVGINKAQKREGEGMREDGVAEKIIKKRKLEREKGMKEAEAVFGPPIGS
ncbi:CyclinH/Ccl1 [Lasallia pustulata]|uniref:CyclinH/Ccl1 n=1 Tax=Lasallia pustulata TaxID=136370 RepID=A0A1W5D912_9LECA|nr:CyclinH/Ccl1 [Lasallia pustulata]